MQSAAAKRVALSALRLAEMTNCCRQEQRQTGTLGAEKQGWEMLLEEMQEPRPLQSCSQLLKLTWETHFPKCSYPICWLNWLTPENQSAKLPILFIDRVFGAGVRACLGSKKERGKVCFK